jgi:broad specificity phosphatase PhoE
MVRVHLIRHGRAAAGWDTDPDPGLDDIGRAQAGTMARSLVSLGPLPVVTSPLRRCRETAAPLAAAWGVTPVVEPDVAEIPSPEGVPLGERVAWLRQAVGGTWPALGSRYTAYRDAVVAKVASFPADTVVVSHFVAINAVIGACLGDDRVLIRSLDNCSCTIVDVGPGGALVLVESGTEAETLIREGGPLRP